MFTYYYNGTVYTGAGGWNAAGHLLVSDGGQVVHAARGTNRLGLDFEATDFDRVRQGLRGIVRCVDLKGRTIIPGITDSHAHFLWWGSTLAELDLSGTASEEECVARAIKYADGRGADEWIVGMGWAHNQWSGAALPSRASLDAALGNRPAILSSKCGHLAWVNSAALAAAGLDDTVADPDGGEFERANGRLTGILKETAIRLVSDHVGALTTAQRQEALARAQEHAHALGITGMQTPEDLETFRFLQEAHGRGDLTMRINFWMPVSALDDLVDGGIRHGLGDDRLRISAIKVFMDGSLGGRTALMYDDFEGEPGNKGVEVTSAEDILRYTLKANGAGLSMAVHAIGDLAVGNVLAAYDAAAERFGRAGDTRSNPVLRNRVEHLQVYDERDFERISRVKPIASMQPIHLWADMQPAERHWGERARRAYACNTLAKAGCLLVFGSDVPVESCNPYWGLYAATARKSIEGTPDSGWNPQECIPLEAALDAYTRNPAIASGQQHRLGTLEPDKLADFVVLPEDPFKVSAEELRDMKPVATFINGTQVFADNSWEEA